MKNLYKYKFVILNIVTMIQDFFAIVN